MHADVSYARVKSDATAATSYNQRKPAKHRQEMRMIAEGMALTKGVCSILDAPCGVGRASIWLATQGYSVTGADLGQGALQLARQLADSAGVSPILEEQDVFAMSYLTQSFDATLCFRLLHHFDSAEVRRRLIDEICRVSRRYVLISRITPLSITSMRRRLRFLLTGKPVKQYPVAARDLDAEFASRGFVPVKQLGRSAILHSLQLHLYERK